MGTTCMVVKACGLDAYKLDNEFNVGNAIQAAVLSVDRFVGMLAVIVVGFGSYMNVGVSGNVVVEVVRKGVRVVRGVIVRGINGNYSGVNAIPDHVP